MSSSFFGSPRASSDPAQWAGWLGIDTVKLLVLRERAVHALQAGTAVHSSLEVLTAHSLRVAEYAKALMESETAATAPIDQAYLAGLLHDVGLFILVEHLPERAAQVETSSRREKASIWEIEHSSFGVTHAEIGGYLLALWGAPDAIVETPMLHHTPSVSAETTFGVLAAVHVANAVADAADLGIPVGPSLVDMEYLWQNGRHGTAAAMVRSVSRSRCGGSAGMSKILIVDDVPELVKIAAGALKTDGHEVLAAGNGRQALELSIAERPDAILLDVMMPGMDGIEVCRRLKADPQTRCIPVILVTARTDDNDVVRGLDAGADDDVAKPYGKEILAARVRRPCA